MIVTSDSIPTWDTTSYIKCKSKYPVNENINSRIALWKGNITHLKVDGIQNAANNSLLGGGGIDGAIHAAAGPKLRMETEKLNGCETGKTKISHGHLLPCKYVLHTVGPIGIKPELLKSCYITTLDLAVSKGLRTIALCGVSTGVYGYPANQAVHIVCDTVRNWLLTNNNWEKIDKIIFVMFLERELTIYKENIPLYFPLPNPTDNINQSKLTLYYMTLSGL